MLIDKHKFVKPSFICIVQRVVPPEFCNAVTAEKL